MQSHVLRDQYLPLDKTAAKRFAWRLSSTAHILDGTANRLFSANDTKHIA